MHIPKHESTCVIFDTLHGLGGGSKRSASARSRGVGPASDMGQAFNAHVEEGILSGSARQPGGSHEAIREAQRYIGAQRLRRYKLGQLLRSALRREGEDLSFLVGHYFHADQSTAGKVSSSIQLPSLASPTPLSGPFLAS